MKPLTLLTKRLYFGLDPLQLREDFRVSSSRGRMLIDEMVQSGILQPLGAGGFEYAITDSFREYAVARIVEPLPRTRAKMLLDHIGDLARHFNRTATQNKYEIEAVVVFGSYMSLEPELPELAVGVIGRRRMPPLRRLDRRAAK